MIGSLWAVAKEGGFAACAVLLVTSLAAYGVPAKLINTSTPQGVITVDAHTGAQLVAHHGRLGRLRVDLVVMGTW